MAVQVVVELNGAEVTRMPLATALVIGRDKAVELYLDNRALSRRHAKIEKKGAAIWVADLGSQNGTFVNGQRIEAPQALQAEDKIEVGRYHVRIEGAEEVNPNTPVITLSGPEGRHRFAMVDDEIVIGRAPTCDIAIGHKSISRRHISITIKGAEFFCEDLGSQNGTKINGVKINGPTSFSVGDIIKMSDFTVEVGFLDDDPGEQANKTMMIDRSQLAKAAYMDGDIDNMRSSAGRLAVGRGDGADDLQSVESSTRGMNSSGALAAAAAAVKKTQPPAPPKAELQLVVSGHDGKNEKNVLIESEHIVLSEQGETKDSSGGKVFADQAYLVFVPLDDGLVVSVAGDRRLANIMGKSAVAHLLRVGDTLQFGTLKIVVSER